MSTKNSLLKQDFTEAIEGLMKHAMYQDMAEVAGREVAEVAAFMEILEVMLKYRLEQIPDFEAKMSHLRKKRMGGAGIII